MAEYDGVNQTYDDWLTIEAATKNIKRSDLEKSLVQENIKVIGTTQFTFLFPTTSAKEDAMNEFNVKAASYLAITDVWEQPLGFGMYSIEGTGIRMKK